MPKSLKKIILQIENDSNFEQLDMFTDYEILEKQRKQKAESFKRERNMQKVESFNYNS